MKVDAFVFFDAVKHFWSTRNQQAVAQTARGESDQGERSAVTGGQHMNGFLSAIIDLMVDHGVDRGEIFTKDADLPGFYRATKLWDLVVIRGGVLLAAIEVKSQVGPSFGNNFNNRTEEALGTAVDTWTAYREGAFRTSPAPWLGYLMLLEDCPRSRSPVRVSEPHFNVDRVFEKASYARRYEILCRRLVLERQYSAACFLLADRTHAQDRPNYEEPAEDLNAAVFLDGLLRQVQPWSGKESAEAKAQTKEKVEKQKPMV